MPLPNQHAALLLLGAWLRSPGVRTTRSALPTLRPLPSSSTMAAYMTWVLGDRPYKGCTHTHNTHHAGLVDTRTCPGCTLSSATGAMQTPSHLPVAAGDSAVVDVLGSVPGSNELHQETAVGNATQTAQRTCPHLDPSAQPDPVPHLMHPLSMTWQRSTATQRTAAAKGQGRRGRRTSTGPTSEPMAPGNNPWSAHTTVRKHTGLGPKQQASSHHLTLQQLALQQVQRGGRWEARAAHAASKAASIHSRWHASPPSKPPPCHRPSKSKVVFNNPGSTARRGEYTPCTLHS
jgi:hypothetical protein